MQEASEWPSDLKTITCFDFLRLRVPRRWAVCEEREGGQRWVCCETEEETDAEADKGTLWVDPILIAIYAGAAPSADDAAQMVLEGLDDGNPARYRNARRSSLGQEVLLEYEYDGGEQHEPLFFRVWTRVITLEEAILLLQFSLVIVTTVSERPEFRLLQAVVDREIRAADIDRPALERWAGLS